MKSKAILLLFVFLLNASAGFSCTIPMEFKVSLQKEAKCQCCSKKVELQPSKCGSSSTEKNSVLKKMDCCCQISPKNSFPISKLVPQSNLDKLQPFEAEITTFSSDSFISDLKAKSNYSDLSYLLPIHDIRIVIQSFQI